MSAYRIANPAKVTRYMLRMLLDIAPPRVLQLPKLRGHHYVIHVIVGNLDPSDQVWEDVSIRHTDSFSKECQDDV